MVSRRQLLAATGAATALGFAGQPASAASDYYATPGGSGAEDGSSWNDAIPGSDISTFVDNDMSDGDTLHVGSGTYSSEINISNSGASGSRITIVGEDTGGGLPQFSGPWVESDEGSGSYCISLEADVSHLEIKNINFDHWKGMVLTKSGSVNDDVLLENVNIDRTFQGMYLQDFRNSTISNCTITFHEKRGLRFQRGCRNLEVLDCYTDHNEGDYSWTQAWPFGYAIEDGRGSDDQKNIVFRRCEGRHCQQERSSSQYWNGDGFVVENDHPGVEFYDCIAYANQDGGWDDKGDGTYYENCIGTNNGRNFRVWNNAEYHNCLTVNAYSRGGSMSPMGLWQDNSTVVVDLYDVTFHNNDNQAVGGDSIDYAEDCIFATDAPSIDSGTNNVFPSDPDPNFNDPSSTYDGSPRDAYNSQAYGPGQGFWISSDDTAPTAPSNLSSPSEGSFSVDLNWDAASDSGGSGLDHYNVYVDGTKDQEVAAGTTSTTVDGLTSSTSYDFYVTAVDGSGNESSSSNTITVTTDAGPQIQETDSAPTVDGSWESVWDDADGVSLDNVISGSVSGDSDLSATAYVLYDGTNLYAFFDVTDDSVTVDSGTDFWADDTAELFLDVGNDDESSFGADEYQYWFKADGSDFGENKNGATSGVSVGTSTTSDGYNVEVAIPHSTTGESPSDGKEVGIDFHVNDDDDGAGRDGKIAWYDDSDDAYQDPSAFGTLTYNSGGSDGDTTAPSAPSNLSSPAHGTDSVDLDWDASSDSGGSGLDHYNVYVDGTKDQEVTAGTTATTVDGLSSDTSYDFHVTAVDGAGNESSTSNTVTVTTDSTSTSGPAINSTSSAPTIDGTQDSTWDGADSLSLDNDLVGSPSDSDLDATAYALYDADDLYVLVNVTDDADSQDSSAIYKDDSVEIYVDVGNEKESSYDDDEYQYQIRRDGSELVEPKNNATTNVTWATSETASGYNVEVAIPHSTTGESPSDGKDVGFDVHVNDDDDGGDRDHKIAWYDDNDDAWENPSSFGTLSYNDTSSGDSTAPTAPSNLSSPAHDTDSVDLDWDASSDSGGSGLDHYNVYVDGTKDQEVTAGTTSATVSGLSSGTSYDFHVTAVDGAGNESSSSNTVTVTTDSGTSLPSPVTRYTLDGTSATDSEGGNDGTVNGSPTTGVTGKDGDAWTFDGSNDWIAVANDSSLQFTDLTISVWIKTTGLDSNDQSKLVVKSNWSNKEGYQLLDNGSYTDEILFRVMGSGANYDISFPRSAVNDGNWHHVVATKDGSTTTLYLDGQSQDSRSDTAIDSGSSDLGIAAAAGGDGAYDGTLDDVRLYDQALTSSQVQDLYDSY